jgi:putative tricarboxylic transport membrane protein
MMIEADHGKNWLTNSGIWSGLVGLALGVFVVWSGYKLKIGSIHDPGSGFVVFYTGILMCLFAISILVSAVTEGAPTVRSLWAGTRWTKPVIVSACLTVFALVLEPLGFLLSTIPLMVLLLRVIDPVRWTLTIPLAVLSPLCVWWVLKHGLLIQLPAGMFGIG